MGALVWEKANWRSSTPIEPGINTRMCSGCHWSTTSKISSPDGYKSYTNTLHTQVKTLAGPLAKRLIKRLTKRLTQPIAPQLMTSQLHRSKLLLAMVLKSRANNCSGRPQLPVSSKGLPCWEDTLHPPHVDSSSQMLPVLWESRRRKSHHGQASD